METLETIKDETAAKNNFIVPLIQKYTDERIYVNLSCGCEGKKNGSGNYVFRICKTHLSSLKIKL